MVLTYVISRGDGREDIFRAVGPAGVCRRARGRVGRFNWIIHAYCLMTNQYHLLVETPDGNPGKGMRDLNGVYTQRFNRVYQRVGHVFQGRYKAILVQKEAYLLEVARYLVLHPVRTRKVRSASDYPWEQLSGHDRRGRGPRVAGDERDPGGVRPDRSASRGGLPVLHRRGQGTTFALGAPQAAGLSGLPWPTSASYI